MPNWCNNSVTITHEDPAKMSALVEAMNENKFCNFAIPVPTALSETMSGSFGDGEKQAALERQTLDNIQLHGYGNWYDFCVNRWGTKWEVDTKGSVDFDGQTVTVGFESAWSPPCGVYEALVEQGYDVVAYYYEPGMGYLGKWDNGIDESYEIGGETSKTIRAVIGAELDDMFNISESMAEYEDENDESEELTEWIKDGVIARTEDAK
jgi:hypothetical protein